MKSILIAISILLATLYQQSAADFPNQLDPLGIYLPRSELDFPAPFIPRPEDPSSLDVAVRSAFPIEQSFVYQTNQRPSLRNAVRRVSYLVSSFLRTTTNAAKSLLAVPLYILKFLLFPITLTFSVVKFFMKLFFLPVTLAWKAFKVFVYYPLKYLLNQANSPPPPYVVGMPNQPPYDQQMYGQ